MTYNRITLVFPGQGSQYAGMGKDLYDEFPCVKELYDRADEVLDYNLSEQCFRKGTIRRKFRHWDDLNKTVNTQPAVLTTSYACFQALQKTCKDGKIELEIALLAGHSLGEYTALLVAGAMDFKTCLELVRKRATYMTELGSGYPGAGLMAIIEKDGDLDYDKVANLCNNYEVYITLKNTKKQVVVGGSKRQLSEMAKELKKEGQMATMLKVEGPFHTPIMKPAADKFKKELDRTRFKIATKPIVANVSTDAIVDPNHIKQELYNQIFNVVNWRRTVEKIIENGGDLMIEVGPKKVLTNMIKDIDPSIPRLNVEDLESLENTVAELAKQQ